MGKQWYIMETAKMSIVYSGISSKRNNIMVRLYKLPGKQSTSRNEPNRLENNEAEGSQDEHRLRHNNNQFMSTYARSQNNPSENNEVEETQEEREHSIVSRRTQNNNHYMTTYARAGNSSNDDREIVELPEDLNFIFGNNNLDGMCRLTDTERVIRNIPQKLKTQCHSIITIDEVKTAIKETLKEGQIQDEFEDQDLKLWRGCLVSGRRNAYLTELINRRINR